MKKLIPLLLVIVYMNNGHIYRYEQAQSVWDDQTSGGLFDSGHPASLLHVSKCKPDSCRWSTDEDLAVFPIQSVERWEIK